MPNVILDNVKWTIEQVAVFVAEASQKPTKHRSRYYKASFFFTASTVEAIVYLIIKGYCSKNKIDYRKESSYRLIHNLPNDLFINISGTVGIYEKNKRDFVWKDDIDFQAMNQIAFKYKVFNKELYEKLENVRVKRNKIHIQSLTNKDHRYSKKDIEYVGTVISKLLDISKKYGIT